MDAITTDRCLKLLQLLPWIFTTQDCPPMYLLLVRCIGGLNNSETALHECYSPFSIGQNVRF